MRIPICWTALSFPRLSIFLFATICAFVTPFGTCALSFGLLLGSYLTGSTALLTDMFSVFDGNRGGRRIVEGLVIVLLAQLLVARVAWRLDVFDAQFRSESGEFEQLLASLVAAFIVLTLARVMLGSAETYLHRRVSIVLFRPFTPRGARVARQVLVPTLRCFGRLSVVSDPEYEGHRPDEPLVGDDDATQSIQFQNHNWRQGVEGLLASTHVAVFDLTVFTDSIGWEISRCFDFMHSQYVFIVTSEKEPELIIQRYEAYLDGKAELPTPQMLAESAWGFSVLQFRWKLLAWFLRANSVGRFRS